MVIFCVRPIQTDAQLGGVDAVAKRAQPVYICLILCIKLVPLCKIEQSQIERIVCSERNSQIHVRLEVWRIGPGEEINSGGGCPNSKARLLARFDPPYDIADLVRQGAHLLG